MTTWSSAPSIPSSRHSTYIAIFGAVVVEIGVGEELTLGVRAVAGRSIFFDAIRNRETLS